jgi:hypothetical protein
MATNEKRINGRTLNLVPSDPANPASGALCRYGTLVGVAVVTGAGGLATPIDFGPAVYTVSVKGQNAAGNTAVAAGDALFYQNGQAFLDKNSTGFAAGTALAAVNSGATTAIDVALGRYGSEGGADVPVGSITGAMLAAAIAISTTAGITLQSAQATTAGGGAASLIMGVGLFGIYFGSGAPTISAPQGSLYIRSDGSSTATRLYVNTNGTTGWTNFTSAT